MSIQTNQTTLRLGMKGDDVRRLQHFLNDFGFGPVAEDADFGPKTKAAVMSYQSARGLVADGIVGSRTWAAINHDLGL